MTRPSLISLILPLFFILIFGLTTLWSTTPNLFVSQVVFLLIGILAFLLLTLTDRHTLDALSIPTYIASVLILVITYLIGTASRGSLRWIDVGPFRLQPSELVKPFLIMSFAGIFTKQSIHNLTFFVKQFALVALPCLLILLQPDLGSAIVVFIIGTGLIFFSNTPRRYLLALTLILLILSPLFYHLLHDYQRQRLISFINPYADPKRSGYNVIQASIAVGSGQFLGKGVRQGTQSHLKFLPERHTDFAFASFAEEFGFLGVTLLLTSLYFLLDWLARSLRFSPDPYSRLVTLGVFLLFFSQIVINIGMNLGVLPVTGITLPFISYGGNSLISSFVSLGLVYAVRMR